MSKQKRIRETLKVIEKAKGKKQGRFLQKLDFLKSLPEGAEFKAGKKIKGEGGWR